MIIRFHKMYEDVITPDRAHPQDAGMDVFYYSIDKGASKILSPGDNEKFGTGLQFEVPHGYMLQVMNRGSMGHKRSLVVGAHVVDSEYSGEVFIDLHNIGKFSQAISVGDKIAQLVLVPIIPVRLIESDTLYDGIVTINTRGDGALGSTD